MSFGAFKGVYNGSGIYWAGKYNVEGNGQFRTLQEARDAIDRANVQREIREQRQKLDAIAAGAIKAERTGDIVKVYLPTGEQTVSIRQFRQSVFNWIDQFGVEVVMI